MASRNQVVEVVEVVEPEVVETDTTMDDPEEFVAEVPRSENGEGTQSGYSVTLDDLDKFAVDNELKEREYQQMNPPKGDWVKEDAWEFDKDNGAYVKVGDCQPGDINPAGRTYVIVKGHCKPRVEAGVSHDPEFFVRVSFDARKTVDRNGVEKADMATRLYQDCRTVYLAIHGKMMDSKPSTLVKFLVQDHFVINHMKGDNAFLVTKIKRARVK